MAARFSLLRALLFILASTLVVSGGAYGLWRYYSYNWQRKLQDPAYFLTTIVHAPKQTLKEGFLEELFDLSVDQPTHLYAFSVEEARKKLLALSAIESGDVKLLPPDTVYVEYTLRRPVAYLANYANTLVDEAGVAFPAEPFFTPKRLPEFYLDLEDKEQGLHTALSLVEVLNGAGGRVKSVDLLRCRTDCYGKRETVVIVEVKDGQHTLRLDPDSWRDGVERYQQIRMDLAGNAVVDLRSQKMALVGL